jgi:hypothetical protein
MKLGRRGCDFHIGLHKTGTTAFQDTLALNRRSLAKQGFWYPAIGAPYPGAGQHNLAWEQYGDDRFRRIHGDLDELTSELAHRGFDNLIISSEDFSRALYSGGVREINERMMGLGYTTRILLVVRHQADLLIRNYREAIKHGYPESFDRFIGNAVETGQLWAGHGPVELRYERLLGQLDGMRVTVISLADGRGQDSVSRLMEACGIRHAVRRVPPRANESLPYPRLFRMFSENVQASATADGAGTDRRDDRRAESLSFREVVEAFAESNARLRSDFGVEVLPPHLDGNLGGHYDFCSRVFQRSELLAASPASVRPTHALNRSLVKVDVHLEWRLAQIRRRMRSEKRSTEQL